MKNLFKLVSLSLLLSLGGCAVIHFENGPVTPDPVQQDMMSLSFWTFGLFGEDERARLDEADSLRYRRWYHHAIFQVAELSNPVETSKVCRGLKWNQITTEVTPFDAFVGLLDNALLFNASSAGLDLWSPWSVEYSCRP
jgi:hypothetical protein